MVKFLPWRFIIRRAARRYGVIDPIEWMARVRAFSQPSEVQEPIELLRAGIVFHARGLVNVKAIQHNLDWIWPFWVERQFKPGDPSFVPRAFSFSHINLTHRNWTAAGLPDVPVYPIVDPRGLITPLHDGWSIDFWIVPKHQPGPRLFPSKTSDAETRQTYPLENDRLLVRTIIAAAGNSLSSEVSLSLENGVPQLEISVTASCPHDAWLIAAIRPYNPEGIQFVDHLAVVDGGRGITVNKKTTVWFDEAPEGTRMARYEQGDVYHNLEADNGAREISCDAGMATTAALFSLAADETRRLTTKVSLKEECDDRNLPTNFPSTSWSATLAPLAKLEIADEHMRFLYDAAVRTVVLLSAGELVPGPNTYRRFWFRDACLMMAPLLTIGLADRCERMLAEFPRRQTFAGYFLSQDGEWDSNGQVLWIAARFAAITGKRLDATMENSLAKATRWLARKRLPENHPPEKGPAGLLPAGFSAEHLGPNDFYYWDDYWALGGLLEITKYWKLHGEERRATESAKLADEYSRAIKRTIEAIPERKSRGGIPAAPGRRMDAGAIGSMVADYPLHLHPPGDKRLMKTAEILMTECFHRGGFFQQMIHSGINAYLTLDLAQTLLRAGDPRFFDLIRATANLASPTGQWPEAIHPNTLGGCMGDGQHGWAAAEWIMMIRNCFVREEDDELIIGSGIPGEWIEETRTARFGPSQTPWGPVNVSVSARQVRIDANWRGNPPAVTVAVPGFAKIFGARTNEDIDISRA
ncbi:MAG: hypothetical protein V4733_07590 [Verrucomicrobiota bacterium]